MSLVCGRSFSRRLLLLVVLAVVPALGQAAGRSSYSSTSESRVLVLLNDIRHEHGLSAFRASAALRGAARAHSADMIARDYFEHDSPDEAFGKRVRRYLDEPARRREHRLGHRPRTARRRAS